MKKQFTFLTLLFLIGAGKVFAQCSISILTSTTIACQGSDGTATASVMSGTAPFTFLWSAGSQTTSTIVGLSPGIYTVTVEDFFSCTGTATVEIQAVVSQTLSATPASCNGSSNGSATVTPIGGTAPYTYMWSNGADISSISSLFFGVYTHTLTDNNGCKAVSSVTITQPAALTQTISVDNVVCFGSASGSATVTANGGSAPYSYLWSTGHNSAILNNATAGVYTHTLTDNNGCNAIGSVTVSEASTLLVPQSSITSSISCNGELAVVTVTVTGGQAPYVGVGTFSVSAGAHTYTVTDDNGCALTTSVSVTEPDAIAPLSSITTSILCNGGNAVVTVTATGGTGSLAGIADYTVAAGIQTFTVTDDNSCAVTTTINITEPDALVASATSSSTCGSTVATVEVSATGGTTAYTGVGTFTALAGPQSYTVTDANSCTSVATITVALVTNSITPTFNTGSIAASCVGVNDGTAWTRTVTPAGLVLPLSYSWSPSAQTTQTATALAAGDYTCFITDGNGCTYTRTVSVGPTKPTELPITVAPSLTICPATTTTLSVQGVPSYTWSTGANTSSIVVTPTVTTDYTVTGTSFLGCTVMSTVTIVTSTATCLGLNESDFLSASVYPNPAKDMITVSLAKNYDNCSIQVFDAYGKLVLTEQLIGIETTLQTGKLQNGIYFYQIKANGLIISRNKLVKN